MERGDEPPARAVPEEDQLPIGNAYTEEQDLLHTQAILALRLQRAPTSVIVRQMRTDHRIGSTRTRNLLARALRDLAGEVEMERGSTRAETVTRLRMDLVRLRAQAQDQSLTHGQRGMYWRLTQRAEELLAEVEGTLAPIEIELNVKAVHVSYVAELTDEQRQELLDRARDNMRKAAQLEARTVNAEGEVAE